MKIVRGISEHGKNVSKAVDEILRSFPFVKVFAEEVREAKKKVLNDLDYWIDKAMKNLEEKNAYVYFARKEEEAKRIVGEIVGTNKLVVKAKSSVSDELSLRLFLEKSGNEVWETDLGELIVQLAEDKPMHIVAPAIHFSEEDAKRVLGKIGIRGNSPEELTYAVRSFMRKKFLEADVGISGCNAFSVESSSVFLVENEGNIRLVSSLPKKYVAIVSLEKILPEDEFCLKSILVQAAFAGVFPPAYVNVNKPNKDQEFHVIFLDNGRTSDERFREILLCVKCGRCQLECLIFQLFGVNWGGVYGGPMGRILSYLITKRAGEDVFLCTACKKCDYVCPMGIELSKMVRRIKMDVRRSWS